MHSIRSIGSASVTKGYFFFARLFARRMAGFGDGGPVCRRRNAPARSRASRLSSGISAFAGFLATFLRWRWWLREGSFSMVSTIARYPRGCLNYARRCHSHGYALVANVMRYARSGTFLAIVIESGPEQVSSAGGVSCVGGSRSAIQLMRKPAPTGSSRSMSQRAVPTMLALPLTVGRTAGCLPSITSPIRQPSNMPVPSRPSD